MARRDRVPMIAALLLVCFLGTEWNSTVFAREVEDSNDSGSSSVVAAASHDNRSTVTGEAAVARATLSVGAADVPVVPESLPAHAPLTLDGVALTAQPTLWTSTSRSSRGFDLAAARLNAFGQIIQGPPYPYPYPYPPHRHDAAIAAIMIGAAAAITGTAILVYANRPECTLEPLAGGCGYGTKVVGTAVLTGGIVGLFVGALTWQ